MARAVEGVKKLVEVPSLNGLAAHASPLHWGYYFSTLSLRKGRPFWPDMGLRLSGGMSDTLFDLTADAFDDFMDGEDRLVDVSTRHCMSVLRDYLDAIVRLWGEADGHDDSLALSKWVLGSFLGGRESYESLWRSTFFALERQIKGGEVLCKFPADRQVVLERIVAEFVSDIRVTDESLEIAFREPLEDNDLRILSYYDIYSLKDLENSFSPFDAISDTYTTVRFRNLWRDLQADGERDVMETLYRSYLRFARKTHLDKARPDLVHPPNAKGW
jgi:hypothetical protein